MEKNDSLIDKPLTVHRLQTTLSPTRKASVPKLHKIKENNLLHRQETNIYSNAGCLDADKRRELDMENKHLRCPDCSSGKDQGGYSYQAGVPVSHDQAPVWIHEGTLPEAGEGKNALQLKMLFVPFNLWTIRYWL